MYNKVRTFIINDTNIIYTIRLDDDKIIVVHKDINKATEILTDYEFFERYKRDY
jgi:hypothetical protein